MLKKCLKNWKGVLKEALGENLDLFCFTFALQFCVFFVLAIILPPTVIGFLILGVLLCAFSSLMITIASADQTLSSPLEPVFLIPTRRVWFNGKAVLWGVLYLVLLRHRKEVEILSLARLFKSKQDLEA